MKTTHTIQSVLFATLVMACGAKTNPSICDQAGLNSNPACSQTCDPSPGAAETCPSGFHCSPDGKCDAQCDATHACADGFTCDFSTGTCNLDPQGSGSAVDMNCPAVHFTAMPVTPTIEFLIDRSGSMDEKIAGVKKYDAVHSALTGTTGVVTQFEQQVYFGASLFFDPDNGTCPGILAVPRVMGNRTAIDGLFASLPAKGTPTPEGVAAITADFVANPPVAGSPPIIVLATDGDPNGCQTNVDTTSETIAAIQAAYATHLGANTTLPVYVLGVGTGASTKRLSDFARAGQGVAPNNTDCTPGTTGCWYPGSDPTQLAASFQAIIGGVLSCDLTLSGQVNPATAQMDGTVTLNGMHLTPGTDWTVDPNGTTLHILGAACTALKGSATPMVDATFSCGSVIF